MSVWKTAYVESSVHKIVAVQFPLSIPRYEPHGVRTGTVYRCDG